MSFLKNIRLWEIFLFLYILILTIFLKNLIAVDPSKNQDVTLLYIPALEAKSE